MSANFYRYLSSQEILLIKKNARQFTQHLGFCFVQFCSKMHTWLDYIGWLVFLSLPWCVGLLPCLQHLQHVCTGCDSSRLWWLWREAIKWIVQPLLLSCKNAWEIVLTSVLFVILSSSSFSYLFGNSLNFYQSDIFLLASLPAMWLGRSYLNIWRFCTRIVVIML